MVAWLVIWLVSWLICWLGLDCVNKPEGCQWTLHGHVTYVSTTPPITMVTATCAQHVQCTSQWFMWQQRAYNGSLTIDVVRGDDSKMAQGMQVSPICMIKTAKSSFYQFEGISCGWQYRVSWRGIRMWSRGNHGSPPLPYPGTWVSSVSVRGKFS